MLQLGGVIVAGNVSANGGTYFGINTPATGAGSAADFINFQANGVTKLQVSNAGLLNAAGGFAVGASSGSSLTCGAGSGVTSSVFSGGILTGGSCTQTADSLQTAYNNSGATNPQILLTNANGGIKIQDGTTPVAGNLLQISNNGGSTNYLGVSSSAVTITRA